MTRWYNIAHGKWEIAVVTNHNFTPKQSVYLKIHLVGTHGTGFTKELLIPCMEHISQNIRSIIENHTKVQVFWHLFDSPGHGDTTLPTLLSWNDPNCVLPKTTLCKRLTPLGRAVANCAAVVVHHLKSRSRKNELFFSFGHSYGSKGILEAEGICSSLFNAICAFEPPVFNKYKDKYYTPNVKLIANVLKQPRAFETEEELREFVQGSKIYGKFNFRVRELYIKHGYRKKRVKCDPNHTAAILQDASHTSIPVIQSSSCTTMLIVTQAFRGSSRRRWGLWEVGKFKGTAIVHYEPRWNHITVYQQPSEIAKTAASFFTDQILSHLDLKSKM